jgi:hypothetical protein
MGYGWARILTNGDVHFISVEHLISAEFNADSNNVFSFCHNFSRSMYPMLSLWCGIHFSGWLS